MSIVVRDLDFAYGRLPALRSISAAAQPGRITAVLGPNAAGKSTLLRCVIGALRPGAGAVLLDGVDAHRLRGRRLARRVAYVPQRSTVAAAFSVREVVELGRYALPADPGRVDRAIGRLELAEVADRPYFALSVGQQQRVTLARALAQLEPGACLVLDEPTSAMDLRHARQCFAILREIATGGATVLLAMHELAAAAAVADDAWLLASGPPGRLEAAGRADEVMAVERLERVFGVPFAWAPRPGGGRVLLSDPGPAAAPEGI